jgi:D-lactate dehydrogenase
MIGGIVANNASGMCCGTAQNSYRTLAGLRLVLADGSVLDTRDPASRGAIARRRPDLVQGLAELAREVRADEALSARIRHKYRLKNTTGYSLNALVDFHDPIDVLAHLVIGSEGTLAFIRLDRTVLEHLQGERAAYSTISSPRAGGGALSQRRPVAAARRAGSVVGGKPGMPFAGSWARRRGAADRDAWTTPPRFGRRSRRSALAGFRPSGRCASRPTRRMRAVLASARACSFGGRNAPPAPR